MIRHFFSAKISRIGDHDPVITRGTDVDVIYPDRGLPSPLA